MCILWRNLHTNRTLLPACLHTVVCQSTQACAKETSRDREYWCTIKARRKKALGKTSLSCLQFLAPQVGECMPETQNPTWTCARIETHGHHTAQRDIQSMLGTDSEGWWNDFRIHPLLRKHICALAHSLIPLFIMNILIFCHWLHWYIISQWKTPTVSGLAHETALVCFKV